MFVKVLFFCELTYQSSLTIDQLMITITIIIIIIIIIIITIIIINTLFILQKIDHLNLSIKTAGISLVENTFQLFKLFNSHQESVIHLHLEQITRTNNYQ